MGIFSGIAADALTAVVPEAGIPLKILGWLKGAGSFIATHPAACALALAAGVIGWQHHEIGTRDAELAKHDAASAARDAIWARAFATEQSTVAVYKTNGAKLLDAITLENASIERLAAASAARQAAATADLNASAARVQALGTLSAQLRADAAQVAPAGACEESAALKEARTKL